MKQLSLLAFFLCAVCLYANAQIPGTISYQGYLTNDAGAPIDGEAHSLTFKFYDASTLVATRIITGVTPSKGLFTVIIGKDASGDNAPLPFAIWTKPLTVGVTVDSGTELPKISLTATPYAFVAQTAFTVNASNITNGTLPSTVLDANLQDLADGTLSDARLEATIDKTAFNASDYITAVGGIHVGSTSDPANNLLVDGFTKLGADAATPLIKMKKFTGTTAAAQGSTVSVAHGLTSSKILSVSLMIEYGTGTFVPASFSHFAGYEVNYYITQTNIVVANIAANSASVVSKPFTMLVTYEQ